MGKTRYDPEDGSVQRARKLRQDSTPAEDALWSILRGSKLDGRKFRRQQRFGPYFGDLVCHDARLVVEADGDSHFDEAGKRSDALRTAYIEREGYRVLRFTNHEIMTNLDGVAETIRAAL
ncbi:MAG: DUF559 domain-containing protein, partial [Pseudomonadota bacterium]